MRDGPLLKGADLAAHTGLPFAELDPVARLLADLPAPWFVAGGWAVDLFVGRRTRDHEDVDVAVLRRDLPILRAHLSGWDVRTARPGLRGALDPWPESAPIPPDAHEVHARRPEGPASEVEFLVEESREDAWAYRRRPSVTRPLRDLGLRSPGGVPFLAPEVVLLYKATRSEEARHAADFAALRPRLPAPRRAWLAAALAAAHPGCPWIAAP